MARSGWNGICRCRAGRCMVAKSGAKKAPRTSRDDRSRFDVASRTAAVPVLTLEGPAFLSDPAR